MRLFVLLVVNALCLCPNAVSPSSGQANETGAGQDNAALMARLVKAYPDYLKGVEGNDIIWVDGTRMPFDDGVRNKPFDRLLDAPSLRDEFNMTYPAGQPSAPPSENFDPGRVRYEPFFAKMYGDCERPDFKKNLVSISWLPHRGGETLVVSKINGIDKKLEAISAELEALPETYLKYLTPTSGVLACRVIAGTTRKSMHAYAAALDINTKYSHYWLWSQEKYHKYKYENSIPYEIARIFEKHGFIWGAKWYHFDTMHFEYRPEMLNDLAVSN